MERARPGGLEWRWMDGLRGAMCALPALPLAVASGDPGKGLTWAVGCLPAAMLGLAPTRYERRRLLVVGVLFAISVLAGSLLAQTAVTTVVGLFVVGVGASIAASRHPFGLLIMTLCLPVCAVGLSYGDVGEAVGLGIVFVVAAVFAYLLFLCWPEVEDVPAAVTSPLLPKTVALGYGVLLGLAGATSALFGLVVNIDHLGWAPAAGYFVMRPAADMQRLRSVGRIVSVAVGALAAVVFLRTGPPDVAIAVFGIVLIAGASGVRTSRWYVTPAFGAGLVLTLLLYAEPIAATERWRFNERVGATIVGVAVAYFYGLVVPSLTEARPSRRSGPTAE